MKTCFTRSTTKAQRTYSKSQRNSRTTSRLCFTREWARKTHRRIQRRAKTAHLNSRLAISTCLQSRATCLITTTCLTKTQLSQCSFKKILTRSIPKKLVFRIWVCTKNQGSSNNSSTILEIIRTSPSKSLLTQTSTTLMDSATPTTCYVKLPSREHKPITMTLTALNWRWDKFKRLQEKRQRSWSTISTSLRDQRQAKRLERWTQLLNKSKHFSKTKKTPTLSRAAIFKTQLFKSWQWNTDVLKLPTVHTKTLMKTYCPRTTAVSIRQQTYTRFQERQAHPITVEICT